MNMVIAVGEISGIDDAVLRKLGSAVGNLISDSHKLALIQELSREQSTSWRAKGRDKRSPHGNGVRSLQTKAKCRNEIREHALSVALHAAGVVTFTLSGLDGQVLALRKRGKPEKPSAYSVEVSAVSPFWIDVIAEKAAVPVFLNEGIDCDGQRCVLDAVQLATACAIGWDADVLVLLDRDEGVRNYAGSVIRWLEVGQRDGSPDSHSEGDRMLDKVQACGAALRAGVRRARILPWSQIDCLEDFFRAKIDYGTEIILCL